MATYEFKLTLTGTGDTEGEAWTDAVDAFCADPGEPSETVEVKEINWVTLCKRTEDPKLAYIELLLADLGIESRRNGESFHAPILEVPDHHEDRAWELLSKVMEDGRTLDDIPDDDPLFGDCCDV